MLVISHKGIQLKDRFLCFDGDVIVEPSNIRSMLLKNVKNLCVTGMTDELEQTNKFLSKSEQICIKADCKPLDYQWNIPESYKTLNVILYVYDIFEKKFDISHDEYTKRLECLVNELVIYKKLNLFPFLQALIYMIDTFEKNSIIWGVGRGSSVASYVLYLLKVHDIDSYAYALDIADFLVI